MKYLDEFRAPRVAKHYIREINLLTQRPWTIMEVCGGQTHAIVKHGIDRLLPKNITLLHGPGCPVCITPAELIDKATEVAMRPNVILCSFGDMIRVRGSTTDLLSAKAAGADVRIVYSPLDSLRIAQNNPHREVVFFAIGFETTAPTVALTLQQALQSGLTNYSVLSALTLVFPAVKKILSAPNGNIDGLLAAGHVCTVTGYREYETVAASCGVPIVVTGFEPLDILQGIHLTVSQLEQGTACVENQYSRVVRRDGNRRARQLMNEVFRVVDRNWRGMGVIKSSGLALSAAYGVFNAESRFSLYHRGTEEPGPCLSGLVLQGKVKPYDCLVFGSRCTPEHPLGATMVSTEGACAAYYRYGPRHRTPFVKTEEIVQ